MHLFLIHTILLYSLLSCLPWSQTNLNIYIKLETKLRRPGIEPGSTAWNIFIQEND